MQEIGPAGRVEAMISLAEGTQRPSEHGDVVVLRMAEINIANKQFNGRTQNSRQDNVFKKVMTH